jgi:acetamidase/formamidase
MLHTLRATPETCFWGFFDAARPPVLRVRSGDLVRIETLTHQAGDAPDLMMDDGVKEKGRDEDVKVQDIAELLIEAIEAGERTPAPAATARFQTGL